MRLFFVVCISLFLFNSAFAECESAKTAFDLYECALKVHPQHRAAVISQGLGEAYEDRARQWPNPELSVRSTSGKNAGENMGGTELDVSISVSDLVINRSAKIDLGKAERKLAQVEAEEYTFKAKQQLIRDLYRYRQVSEELSSVTEALEAFRKIESQFTSRRARGPEQEVSLNLVQLAQGDYELKKNHLAVEKDEILTRFKGFLGDQFDLRKELLPSPKTIWPELKESLILSQSFELRKAEAQKDKLAAERSLAVAESWPTISAGPTIERVTEGSNSFHTYGFNLNVELPLLSQNGGGRNVANRTAEIAKLEHQYSQNQERLRQQRLLQVYRSAVESLKRSVNREALNRKHKQIDNLFKSGLASGATVIEAHRQITEFTESQHEHELLALDSLMQIKFLQRQDLNEVLK